jgi:hypothetical protein
MEREDWDGLVPEEKARLLQAIREQLQSVRRDLRRRRGERGGNA